MQRRDYLLRMIEQIGQMLTALRKRIAAGAESADVDASLRSVAASGGVDLDIARLSNADTLVLFVAPAGEVEPTRCWMFAELLFLDGLQARAEGRSDDAWASFEKAHRLYELIEPGGALLLGWPEAGARIEEIEALMREG
jgi:hypothetical protein